MFATTRRKFIALVGAAPLAGQMAAQQLAGVGSVGAASQAGAPAGTIMSSLLSDRGVPATPQVGSELPRERKRMLLKGAMKVPAMRAQLEAMAYEECRVITYLDHDLASKRSFSLAAKIAFQRQRNVERHMEYVCQDSVWMRVDDWAQAIFKGAMPKLF